LRRGKAGGFHFIVQEERHVSSLLEDQERKVHSTLLEVKKRTCPGREARKAPLDARRADLRKGRTQDRNVVLAKGEGNILAGERKKHQRGNHLRRSYHSVS